MGVALFAMNPLGDCRPPDSDSGLALHGTFAAVFFAAIAVVCGWFPARHWVLSYLCAGVMAFCIVVALVYTFILPLISLEWKESLCRGNVVFKLEAAAVWAFCAYWLLKTLEMDQLPLIHRRWRRNTEGAHGPDSGAQAA